ncbi:serine/threonine-protein kinase [Actinomycetospora flava]|uniref:non-specific serine/threonine protein kinase n=1 Tax=Actinomycetospora flava TaxID=3129232 RepID=A0ABU8MFQ2_9PSEU
MADEGELIAERYRVRARVGQGAMGVVWRAEDERLRREVALKQVSLPAGADEEARDRAHRRVFREGRMIARLHHPHAIAVYDVVEHEGGPWLVMEYLASRSLAEVLAAHGPLVPDRVARLGRQVADALAAAHEAGIVHRDVKPGNVLLADDGLVKVTDFGIARAVDDVTLTSTGMMAGTPAYLAPEVARGGAADFRSDVYSLGSTLYTALEGAPPFGTGDNPLAVLHRVASGEYAPPVRRGAITALVEALLRPEPEGRPPMGRVRDDLARLLSAEAVTEEGPVTPVLARPAPTPTTVPAAAPPPMAVASPAPPDTRPATTSPVPGPMVPEPVPDPEPEPEPEPGGDARRRRWPWVVGALAAVVVAAVVVVALSGGIAGRPGASVPGGAGGGSADSTDSTDSTGSTAAPGAGSGGSSALAGSAEDQARQQAVIDYYALIPDRLDEGWQRLTPSFQQGTAGGFDGYRGFWSTIAQVTVRGVSPAGGEEVDATVTYRYADGREVDERTVFRLVDVDGIWKIDGQRQGS